jgi:ribosome-binding factor A
MDQKRLRRLEELLREEIALLISSGELKDPRVGPFVSITRVEASRDGGHAKVWVSVISEDEKELLAAAEGLSSAAGYVQSQIARRTRLRLTPVLSFVADRGIREGFEMNELIKGLTKE